MLQKAASYIEEIHTRFKSPWTINAFHDKINVSIAVVQVPEQASEQRRNDWLARICCKGVKKNGKGKLIYCDETMQHAVDRRNKVIRAVKNAMEYNGFEVYYQPIHRIKDGSIKSAEALLRLHDDELGIISPGEFIPIAERNRPDYGYRFYCARYGV